MLSVEIGQKLSVQQHFTHCVCFHQCSETQHANVSVVVIQRVVSNELPAADRSLPHLQFAQQKCIYMYMERMFVLYMFRCISCVFILLYVHVFLLVFMLKQ